jgi:hypothetical protein
MCRVNVSWLGTIFDASGDYLAVLVLKNQASRVRAGDDREIGPLFRCAFQKGVIGARALA